MEEYRTFAMCAGVPSPNGHSQVILQLENVTKHYGDVTAVDGVSLSIDPGEVFTLLGPSGCGKSTTLRLVAGLEQPDDGRLLLKGQVIASGRDGMWLPPERRNMGMVFQSYAIWPHMSVFANVAFPLTLRRTPRQQIRERVKETLELVGLGGLEDRPATMLSGGQQQRVALARALVYNPELLLLDEPLSNLDARLREHMRLELRTLQRRLGIAVLFVTHDQHEAMSLSDRVAVMNRGRIEQVGTPSDVYERPATPFVRDFLGRAIVLEGLVQRSSAQTQLQLTGEGGGILVFENGVLEAFGDASRLSIACRPEDVRLEPPGPPGKNRLSGTVQEAAYLGERVEYRVRTRAGQELHVFGPSHERHPIGASVDLVISTSTATVWAQ
jgi:ABC-type Fe3+/spermidine/putrescine transport system ATPase subunit